ncbi:protease inhibitor I42 family protein [Leptodesmis sichuanensis]|uniref:protease inhibitor I42 family protein n=1 Tax=Leptodesmis sichuanensis TaxID=2906798 RepID=UPI001F38CCF0|nr:protease inhibitor I42 family protein [Leptodesmis sichuanensis]UIE36792.1 protease inhibitor I42 family protein [Leptodesmis sichuanensis A121]
MSDITLTNADNGKTLTLKPGQTLTLRLPENPTTGYRWSISSLNAQVLQLIDDRFESSSAAAIGGGGQRVLTFQAQQPGQISLSLNNRREWQDAASPLESFTVMIQVAQQ